MDPLVWIALGLGVGLLAALVGGDGLFGDLLFGLLGGFLGGWIGDVLAAATPLAGLAGSALAALGGAAAFVLALRLVGRVTAGPA